MIWHLKGTSGPVPNVIICPANTSYDVFILQFRFEKFDSKISLTFRIKLPDAHFFLKWRYFETVILTFKGHVGTCPKRYYLTCQRFLWCSYIVIPMWKIWLKINLIFRMKLPDAHFFVKMTVFWDRDFDIWRARRDMSWTLLLDLQTSPKVFLHNNSDVKKLTQN